LLEAVEEKTAEASQDLIGFGESSIKTNISQTTSSGIDDLLGFGPVSASQPVH
jgi:hypothetical protein